MESCDFTGKRFTLSGLPELDGRIAKAMREISAEIAALPESADLICVLLGGGYGRGEGGTRKLPDGGTAPYNDFDFFVIRKNVSAERARALDDALKKIAEKRASALGIDVDFAPGRTPESLKKVTGTLMFRELRAGNVPVYGTAEVLEKALKDPDFAHIPLSEGARLLMNRGGGLLLASGKLEETPSRDADDFILRNFRKAVLGCGDAMLIRAGLYRPDIRVRTELLKACSPATLPDGLAEEYALAAEFKMFPYERTRGELEKEWEKILFLWFESVRLFCGIGGEIPDGRVPGEILRAHATDEGNIFRNLIIHVLLFLSGRKKNFSGCFSHPRKYLLASLWFLLFEKTSRMEYIKKKRSNMSSTEWLNLWNRFN